MSDSWILCNVSICNTSVQTEWQFRHETDKTLRLLGWRLSGTRSSSDPATAWQRYARGKIIKYVKLSIARSCHICDILILIDLL